MTDVRLRLTPVERAVVARLAEMDGYEHLSKFIRDLLMDYTAQRLNQEIDESREGSAAA